MNYPEVNSTFADILRWRCIGPYRGGRVVAVCGDPVNEQVFYFGGSAGGVWKTVDAGTYWENISDGFFKTAAVGAIAVANSDPNIIYVGTGEACLRSDVSHGDGVYKSTDAGKTWANVGLEDTRHIARIRIHPSNPDVAYVAALGHAWGSSKDRGIYRTENGGDTWELVLPGTENSGGIDLSMDASNPRVIYAALFETQRLPWTMYNGGPGSKLFKTTDGGDSWVDITQNKGMPEGVKGRIAVALAPKNPERVWALIEAEKGGLYRSDDGGETWQLLTGQTNLWWRAHYYTHLFADTQDPDTCYILSVELFKSNDGGYTFVSYPTPHGDNHDLWIDPRNSERMIEANDGGATVSLNGGGTWSTLYNQPTASLFHLTTDSRFPYRVYGTQNDNTAIAVPSRANEGAISWKDCYPVGTAESGHIAVRVDDPDIIYAGAIGSSPGGGGNLLRYDNHTGQTRIITVWPEDQGMLPGRYHKYRFQFHFPTLLSPHDPNTLYVAANIVFRSRDEGTSWEAISPDLTRNDVSKMSEIPGGPITNQVIVSFDLGSILAFTESPIQPGLLWAGSDDGLVHVSKNDGREWENVTPKDMEEWTHISTIEPSPHDPAVAYLAASRYRLDELQPILYRTKDYGSSWQLITNGIPEHDFTRVIREDPSRKGLLYAGTETGMYVSFDEGDYWQSLQLNLPVVPIHDFVVKENDLVVATHGRSFWILDDLTPLHQLTETTLSNEGFLFKPRVAYRPFPHLRPPKKALPGRNYQRISGGVVAFYEQKSLTGENHRIYLDAGANPVEGMAFVYYLQNKPVNQAKLEIIDASGNKVVSFTDSPSQTLEMSANVGMNRFVWDMRHPDAKGEIQGIAPVAVPGKYEISFSAGELVFKEEFEILKDPRVVASQADLRAQFNLMMKIRDDLSICNQMVAQARSIRSQINRWLERAENNQGSKTLTTLANQIDQKMTFVEETTVSILGPNPQKPPPTRLAGKLLSLSSVVASADWIPTTQAYEVFSLVSEQVKEQSLLLKTIVEDDVASFVKIVDDLGVNSLVG